MKLIMMTNYYEYCDDDNDDNGKKSDAMNGGSLIYNVSVEYNFYI